MSDLKVIEVSGEDVRYIWKSASKSPLTVLFLHGIRFGPEDWQENGIVEALASNGYNALAIGLPVDKPNKCVPEGVDPGAWLSQAINDFREKFGFEKIVLVSPSFSGFYSLAMLQSKDRQQVAGFVPIAPKNVDNFAGSSVATRIVWGTDDRQIPFDDLRIGATTLQDKIPGSQVIAVEGGGHAFYFGAEKDFFVRNLLEFCKTLTESSSFELA